MFVGHSALAFALVAGAATRYADRRRALRLGLAAAAFAAVPDVDVAFAVAGILDAGPTGVWSATAAFWAGADVVHRSVTHSVVLAVPAAIAFALVAADRRPAAAGVLAALVVVGFAAGGRLAAGLLVLYAAVGVAVALGCTRLDLDARAVLATALLGLCSHPFGDVFTGEPPRFLYPLDGTLLAERIALHPDPTPNLLSVFGLELATLWLAVGAAAWLTRRSLRSHLDPRAAVGAGYGAIAVVLPAPTLEVSYHYVFSVLAVGTVGAPLSPRPGRRRIARAAVTGLAAISLGLLASSVVYTLS